MIRNIIVCIVILFGQRYASGQPPHVEGILRGDKVFEEKIYLHTDKEFYMPGELIWFKVYVVDAGSLQPSAISQVAYVDILDSNYTSVLRAKIELGEDRSNSGSLYIPNDIASGAYHVVAYTHFMKNRGPERFFNKQVTVLNPFPGDRQKVAYYEPDADHVLQVYPESGILLDGVATRIGYKLHVRGGRGMVFDAVVTDDRGVELSRFTANRHGMGSFALTPRAGMQYRVAAVLPNGSIVNAAIPEVTPIGYLFNVVRDQSNDLNVTVAASPIHANKRLYLRVQSNGHVHRTEEVLLDDMSKATVRLEKALLPDGVIRLTLFDADDEPVAERLAFQYPAKQLTISTELNTKTIDKRDAVGVLIKSSVEGKPVVSDLSVAVYRTDQLQKRPTSDIMSYLWLQSEVRGHIEDIGYYFSGANQRQLAAEMDDLLLTQGWRRIKPKSDPGIIAEYKSQRVVIRYTDRRSKRPLAGEAVFLSVPGKNHRLYVGETNNDGIAHFNIKSVYGPVQLATRLVSSRESDVELLPAFYDGMSAARLPTANLEVSSADADAVRSHSITVQAENAYHKQERAQFLKLEIDTLPFYGSADKTYLLDDYTRFIIMEEVLSEYVPEINVQRRQSDFNLRVFNQRSGSYFNVDPLILLDGIPMTNANELMSYNPLNLQKMDIITSKYYHGPLEYDGVVSVSTYNGTLDGFQLHPSTTLLNYEGVQYEREFFTPVYETESERSSRLPDLRSVLLWEPDLKTTASGESRLVITTSDLSGEYIVVVEGLDEQGNVGSCITPFTVR